MGLRLCKAHGVQRVDALVSQRIADSMKAGSREPDLTVREIVIVSEYGKSSLWADESFIQEFLPAFREKEIILYDRCRETKQLRGRLLVRKVVKAMTSVCPECLKEHLR